MDYTVHKTEYLNEQNLDDLWIKIKQYVSAHGGSGTDLSAYATKEYVTQAISATYETKEELATALLDYAKANHNHDGVYQPVGDYALKSDIPTVPTKVSAFSNDAGYLTTHQDLSNYYTKSETYNKSEVDAKVGTGGTGADGYSPVANVTQTDTGATITITDKTGTTTATVTNGTNGTNGSNGTDGISPTATVTSTSTGATISITDKSGTTTANIVNGTNGTNGADGKDGVSPTIVANSSNSDTVYKLDITDKNGTFTTPNLKGADGTSGGGGTSSGVAYSTTAEETIGTYNGATLYRKVLLISGLTAATSTITHNIGFTDLIKCEGMMYYGGVYCPIPTTQWLPNSVSGSTVSALKTSVNETLAYSVFYLMRSNNVQIYANDFYSYTFRFILEYTK